MPKHTALKETKTLTRVVADAADKDHRCLPLRGQMSQHPIPAPEADDPAPRLFQALPRCPAQRQYTWLPVHIVCPLFSAQVLPCL